MGLESMPTNEAKKEDINSYTEQAKNALIEKTLERIKLAPDSRKAEVLEEALNFYGTLSGLIDVLDSPNTSIEGVQSAISETAERAGLDPEIISVEKYAKLMWEYKEGLK